MSREISMSLEQANLSGSAMGIRLPYMRIVVVVMWRGYLAVLKLTKDGEYRVAYLLRLKR